MIYKLDADSILWKFDKSFDVKKQNQNLWKTLN